LQKAASGAGRQSASFARPRRDLKRPCRGSTESLRASRLAVVRSTATRHRRQPLTGAIYFECPCVSPGTSLGLLLPGAWAGLPEGNCPGGKFALEGAIRSSRASIWKRVFFPGADE
jgi:hypothetical protein